MHYYEPFVGYAHVLRRVVDKRSYTASDDNALLMRLLTAVQSRQRLPTVTEDEYFKLKHQKGAVSLKRAVACFTYSYCGKEWGGYVGPYEGANGTVRVPAQERLKYYGKLQQNPQFMATALSCCDFGMCRFKPRSLIYCDPPYQDSSKYGATGNDAFDSARFWRVVRRWSEHHVVFVSEYRAPDDFILVSEATKHACVGGGGKQNSKRHECLFMHEACIPLVTQLMNRCDAATRRR